MGEFEKMMLKYIKKNFLWKISTEFDYTCKNSFGEVLDAKARLNCWKVKYFKNVYMPGSFQGIYWKERFKEVDVGWQSLAENILISIANYYMNKN